MLREGETRSASAPRSDVRSLDGMNGTAASCALARTVKSDRDSRRGHVACWKDWGVWSNASLRGYYVRLTGRAEELLSSKGVVDKKGGNCGAVIRFSDTVCEMRDDKMTR